MTDMEVPIKGSLLAYQGLPPRERKSLKGARTWFLNYLVGDDTRWDMCVELGCHNVLMLFLERSEHHLTYLATFYRNLAQLYCAQKHKLAPVEWTLGILFNVHRSPLDQHGNEQVQVGFNLAHGIDILHQSTWTH